MVQFKRDVMVLFRGVGWRCPDVMDELSPLYLEEQLKLTDSFGCFLLALDSPELRQLQQALDHLQFQVLFGTIR